MEPSAVVIVPLVVIGIGFALSLVSQLITHGLLKLADRRKRS